MWLCKYSEKKKAWYYWKDKNPQWTIPNLESFVPKDACFLCCTRFLESIFGLPVKTTIEFNEPQIYITLYSESTRIRNVELNGSFSVWKYDDILFPQVHYTRESLKEYCESNNAMVYQWKSIVQIMYEYNRESFRLWDVLDWNLLSSFQVAHILPLKKFSDAMIS